MRFQKTLLILTGALLLIGAGCSRPASNSDVGSQMPAPGYENKVNEMVVEDNGAPEVMDEQLPVVSLQPAKTVTINYTGSAFSPSTVTISSGDIIKFVNTGRTAAVWPASNPHPTHTGLRGFDAGAPLDTGGTYSFTFIKTGTFGYHNHLNPSQTGTIIVK